MKKNPGKKLNPFISFLLFFVVPLIIAITIITVILSFAGVSVGDWAKNKAASVLGVETSEVPEETVVVKEQLVHAENMVKEQTEVIEALEAEVLFLEGTVERLNNEVLQAETRVASYQENATDKEGLEEVKPVMDSVEDIATSFTTMRNKQAAKIMEELTEEVALKILIELPKDVRGDILGAMDPELAARLTTDFINNQ